MSIAHCHQCPFRQQGALAGPCACTIDGKDIIEHVEQGECPKGFFAHPVNACAHRGESLGEVPCPTCPGNVTAKVNACTAHGRATLFAVPIDGVKCCRTCSDRVPITDQAK